MRRFISKLGYGTAPPGPVDEGEGEGGADDGAAMALPVLDELRPLFQRELRRARRYERRVSVLALSFPPELATEMRQTGRSRLARLLQSELRETDLVVRVPGRDEVLALLPEACVTTAEAGGARIRQLWAAHGAPALLVGTATYPDDALTLDDLFEAARSAAGGSAVRDRGTTRSDRKLVDA